MKKLRPSEGAIAHLLHSESPGLSAAIEATYAEKRKPTDDDRPAVSVFPGRKPKILEGQLRFGDEC